MIHDTKKLIRLALLVSVGLVLYVFEVHIPQPLPWARIGLANLVTLMALTLWGFREAAAIAAIRILLASLITGTLMSPVFPFALAGGLASLVAMGLAWRYLRPTFSVVGISVLGALGHNLAQLYLAYRLYIQRGEVLYLLPLLLLSTVVTGFFIGAAASLVTAGKTMRRWIASPS
jgi:heptaprenyl diphosphate synthase